MVTQKPSVDAGTDGDVDAATEGGPLGASYTFDADIQGWHYTPYGSSPNIGFADTGGVERPKLSDVSQSQLAFDGFLGVPQRRNPVEGLEGLRGDGKDQAGIGRQSQPIVPDEGLALHHLRNGLRHGALAHRQPDPGVTDWVTLTFDLDAPLGGTPDANQVNQLGIRVSTSTCN